MHSQLLTRIGSPRRCHDRRLTRCACALIHVKPNARELGSPQHPPAICYLQGASVMTSIYQGAPNTYRKTFKAVATFHIQTVLLGTALWLTSYPILWWRLQHKTDAPAILPVYHFHKITMEPASPTGTATCRTNNGSWFPQQQTQLNPNYSLWH